MDFQSVEQTPNLTSLLIIMTNFIQHRKFGRYKPMYRSAFAHPRKKGFTLVELLVVVVIAGILMSMVLVALRGAQEDADRAKTRATIRKIDVIIQDLYEQYRYESPDVLFFTTTAGSNLSTKDYPTVGARFNAANTDSVLHAQIRLAAVRDLLRLDMPDCAGDMFSAGLVYKNSVVLDTTYDFLDENNNPHNVFCQVDNAPRNAQIRSMLTSRAAASFATGGFLETNFNAELLFLIVESSYVAGSYGIESFSNSEIADTDGDGLREFIDAWGNPIQWLRWPSGYYDDSIVSQSTNLKALTSTTPSISRFDPDPMGGNFNGLITLSQDDFDPTKADAGYFTGNAGDKPTAALRPLIVSSGPDGVTALRFLWTGQNGKPTAGMNSHFFSLSNATLGGTTWPDPYYPRPSSSVTYSASANQSLGGVLNVEVDSLNGASTTRFGLKHKITPTAIVETDEVIVEGQSAAAINAQILEYVSDNVTNFDETGGSI